MRPGAWRLRLPVAAACVLAPVLMLADVRSPLRLVAALVLFALAPGAALLPLIRERLETPELGLVVATSLAVCVLAAQVMLWLGAWSPSVATCGLAALCLAGIGGQLARERRRRARPVG